MKDHKNAYERAFAAFLRGRRVACIPVEETHRPLWQDGALKNVDFIVPASSGNMLMIDVKGRRITPQRSTRENWATADDVESLVHWQELFGAVGLLVFVYDLPDASRCGDFHDSFTHGARHYGCLAAPVDAYRRHLRVRSPKWGTVNLAKADFERVTRPISSWL